MFCVIHEAFDRGTWLLWHRWCRWKVQRATGQALESGVGRPASSPVTPRTTGSITPRPRKLRGLRSPCWSHLWWRTHNAPPHSERRFHHSSKGKQNGYWGWPLCHRSWGKTLFCEEGGEPVPVSVNKLSLSISSCAVLIDQLINFTARRRDDRNVQKPNLGSHW